MSIFDDIKPSCYHGKSQTGQWVISPMALYRASKLMRLLNKLGVVVLPYDSLINFYEDHEDEPSDF